MGASQALGELGAQPDRPLAPLTSLKVGGAADWLLPAGGSAIAAEATRAAAAAGLAVTYLGGGSNLLVSARGVAGLVVKPTWSRLELRPAGDEALVHVDAGHSFPALARRLARLGWAGLEWAVSVPGRVGGAVVNNAGAFGGCVQDCLLELDVVDARGVARTLPAEALAYRYRWSRLKAGELGTLLVVAAHFRVRRGDPTALRETVLRLQAQRTRTQPRQQSAGSVFANPPGDYAGRLIEACGLKGVAQGRAQISPQHANFIVNLGGASADDVYALVVLAQQAVWRQHGIWLRPEVQLVGRWTEQERRRLETPNVA
jgi:UDP-N-acetylmuramate dehydrogenase